jgi:hypothetical protein
MTNLQRLTNAIHEVGASSTQARMALILFSQKGIEHALAFVYGLQKKGLTQQQEFFQEREETHDEWRDDKTTGGGFEAKIPGCLD